MSRHLRQSVATLGLAESGPFWPVLARAIQAEQGCLIT